MLDADLVSIGILKKAAQNMSTPQDSIVSFNLPSFDGPCIHCERPQCASKQERKGEEEERVESAQEKNVAQLPSRWSQVL